MTTLNDMARDYVELLNSAPNGWGEHVHPTYGPSHHMLSHMFRTFGHANANRAIDRAFQERRLTPVERTAPP